MRLKFIAGAVTLMLMGAATAFAQTAAQVRQEEMRFRGMDTNSDGQIQRTEWRGSAQSFRVHDWNNDGILSGAEIRTAARREAAEAPDYQPNYYGYNDWSARGFTTLDDNRDGRISQQEWHYDNETFYRVDRDRNGSLSRAEFLNTGTGAFDDDRGDRFDDIDVNGNNRVEKGEWHGSVAAFEWLDRNNDGVLTRAEVVGNAPATVTDDEFTSTDVNRDRFVSRTEWHYSPGSFNRLDTNRDGRLSRVEFDAAGPLGATGTTARVSVNGYDRWTDTGIFVRTGDEITFNATGRIQFSQSADSSVEWRGAPDGRKSNAAPMADVPIGHLIARIGINGAPISAGGTVRASRDGRLYLGINDDVMTDNTGTFQVTVTLRRP
jgi:Ca2+-binding EF-hand superfamily protein